MKDENWYKQRVGKMTGSRIGAAMGLSPYQSRRELIREMVREHHGAPREFIGNVATQWGEDHETEALNLYESITGRFVESTGFHTKGTRYGCNPDGIVGDAIIEVKCPYSKRPFPLSDREDYYAQCQWNMMVMDCDECDFVIWTPDGLTIEVVKYAPEFEEDMLLAAELFLNEYDNELDNPEHLEDKIVTRDDETFQHAVNLYLEWKDRNDRAAEGLALARETLIELANGKKSKGFGVTITPVTKKGSVDYKSIPQLQGIDLDQFRVGETTSWRITNE